LALLFTILTCTLSPINQLITEQDQASLLSFGSIAGVFSALAGRHAVHERVPIRDHQADVAVQSESKSTLRLEDHRRRHVGTGLRVIGEGLVFSIGLLI